MKKLRAVPTSFSPNNWNRNLGTEMPLKILVTEDNKYDFLNRGIRNFRINLKLAVGMLKKLGFSSIDGACNGVEMVNKVEAMIEKSEMYDIILCDLMMPE